MTGPKQLTPFEEVMEPSAGGTLMRESHYWGLALRLLSLAPILLPFLLRIERHRQPHLPAVCFPCREQLEQTPEPFLP